MTTSDGSQTLLLEQLHPSICLLELLTGRPANLDELIIDSKKSSLVSDISDTADSGECDLEEDLKDVEIISAEDAKQHHPKILRNKVLDRLAETLARYKSDPNVNSGPILDPKHVSSTMMIIDEKHNKVEILCAKNEGLDQHDSTDDTDFLNSWKTSMERIARKGAAGEEDKVHMLDMILKYQRPRINYYLNKLEKALRLEEPTARKPQDNLPKLSDEWLQKLPVLQTRTWIDDKENQFHFSGAALDEAENISRVALSAQSLRDISDVDVILKLVDQVSSLNQVEEDDLIREILKQLLPSLFAAWRSPPLQASIQARLRARLQNFRHSEKRQNEAITALKFLCRVYYSVETFVQAAESMPIFKSVECIPIPLQRVIPTTKPRNAFRAQATPLEIANALGLHVRGFDWLRHLENPKTKKSFRRLRVEKRHVHAEIQLLSYQAQSLKSRHEDGFVHPYIGCSKLCCLLCWLLLRVHGAYQVRGTHETIMHRWEIPTILLTETHADEYQPILKDFLGLIRLLLQNTLNQLFSSRHQTLLPQSSAALSTTQTVLDRVKAKMEKPQLNMRQLMMMPVICEDGLLINDLPEKPGFVSVIGGSLTTPKEMACQEAEIYKENHIRTKFGLERTDELPPRQGKIAKRCRRCHRPSSLRCSWCRSTYCSRTCQKKHWSRHVFVCRLEKRPNDVDYLKIFIGKWLRAAGDEYRRAQTLAELYSDDDLCKTFGFNNCALRDDVAKLFCFYSHMTSKLTRKEMQLEVDEGNLGDFMAVVTELIRLERKETYHDCPCFAWFLHRTSFIDCVIPNLVGDFAYQPTALRRLERALSIEERDDDLHPLSRSERAVLNLYSTLFRDLNNIPGPFTSKWLEFGFCFCTNRTQAMKLAKLYVQLAESGASLEEIAKSHESKTLPALMTSRGLNVSTFQASGIVFHSPDLEELGIYRLIAEVHHTLSGRFCSCHLRKPNCHPKFETHLSRESDGDYGFHGTNPWERWQLFNFYAHVFAHPKFSAREMQAAKRDPDKEMLDAYLDSLVPGFRKKIANRVLGDLMFPKLKAGIRFPNGRPPCWCVMHDTVAPEGLDCFTSMMVSRLRTEVQGNEEDAQGDSILVGA